MQTRKPGGDGARVSTMKNYGKPAGAVLASVQPYQGRDQGLHCSFLVKAWLVPRSERPLDYGPCIFYPIVMPSQAKCSHTQFFTLCEHHSIHE